MSALVRTWLRLALRQRPVLVRLLSIALCLMLSSPGPALRSCWLRAPQNYLGATDAESEDEEGRLLSTHSTRRGVKQAASARFHPAGRRVGCLALFRTPPARPAFAPNNDSWACPLRC